MEIVLFLYRNISQICRMREISLPKTMNMISTDDHYEFVLVFMLYYYWFDIAFNGLCLQFGNVFKISLTWLIPYLAKDISIFIHSIYRNQMCRWAILFALVCGLLVCHSSAHYFVTGLKWLNHLKSIWTDCKYRKIN